MCRLQHIYLNQLPPFSVGFFSLLKAIHALFLLSWHLLQPYNIRLHQSIYSILYIYIYKPTFIVTRGLFWFPEIFIIKLYLFNLLRHIHETLSRKNNLQRLTFSINHAGKIRLSHSKKPPKNSRYKSMARRYGEEELSWIFVWHLSIMKRNNSELFQL